MTTQTKSDFMTVQMPESSDLSRIVLAIDDSELCQQILEWTLSSIADPSKDLFLILHCITQSCELRTCHRISGCKTMNELGLGTWEDSVITQFM